MKLFNLGSFLVIFLSIVMFGCTRADRKTSSFSVSIPQKIQAQKVSALTESEERTLTHLIINVSNGDKLLKTQTWDSCRRCKTPTPIPLKVDLGDFESGPDRVVQILGVYEGGSGGSFYYGEEQKSFEGAQVELSIALKAIAASTMKQGRITGRYMTSPNGGPTGDVEIRFLPPGRKSMLLMTSPIVNGWFNFMIFSDIQFSYDIRESSGAMTSMFKDVNLNSSVFTDITSKPLARIEIPANQKTRYDENNNPTLETSDAESVVVGWFGDSASISGKKICYPTSRVAIEGRKLPTSSTESLYWDPLAAAGPTVVTVKGGTGYVTTPPQGCADSDRYNTALMFDAKRVDMGHDGFAGVQGSFRAMRVGSNSDSYDTLTSVTSDSVPATPTMTVAMKLLPGVTASLFDGFNVYKTIDPNFEWHGDGVPCAQLAENKIEGFTKVSHFGLSNSSPEFSFNFQAVITNNNPDVKMIAVCPYKGTTHYSGGVFLRSHSLYPQQQNNNTCTVNCGGPNTNPNNPPVQLRISKYFPRTLHTGGCTSFNAYFVDANGNRTGSSSVPVSFQIKNAGSILTMYNSNDWNCSNTPLGPLATIQPGSGDFFFNINLPAAQASLLLELSPLPVGFSANPTTATTYDYRNPNSTSAKRVSFVGTTMFPGGVCAPFVIQVTNYQGQVKTADANWTLTRSSTNLNPAFKIYDSESCGTEITNLTFSSGAIASKTIWGKFDSAATNTHADVIYSSSTHQIDEGGFSAIKSEIIANASPSGFAVMATHFKEGICQPFFIQPMHDGPNPQDKFPVVAPANISNVNLSITQISPNTGAAGGFYTNADCSTALSTFTFLSGHSVRLLYFKSSSPINGNFHITATGFSPSQSQYYMQEDLATKLELTLLDSSLLEGGICVPLILNPKNDANQLSKFSPGRAITFSTNQGGEFHTSPNCNSPINNGGVNRLVDV
ncbi:MAG: hypothetical protein AB7O96_14680, partial [Pseudobdellovibrionaceae bacterium]